MADQFEPSQQKEERRSRRGKGRAERESKVWAPFCSRDLLSVDTVDSTHDPPRTYNLDDSSGQSHGAIVGERASYNPNAPWKLGLKSFALPLAAAVHPVSCPRRRASRSWWKAGTRRPIKFGPRLGGRSARRRVSRAACSQHPSSDPRFAYARPAVPQAYSWSPVAVKRASSCLCARGAGTCVVLRPKSVRSERESARHCLFQSEGRCVVPGLDCRRGAQRELCRQAQVAGLRQSLLQRQEDEACAPTLLRVRRTPNPTDRHHQALCLQAALFARSMW